MYIKLKNKSEIYVSSSTTFYEKNCSWCGKLIKTNRPHFYSFNGPSGDFCGVAHVKAAANARL